MGPTWGRQDPGGHHVGPMNFAIRGIIPLGSQCSMYEVSAMMRMDYYRLLIYHSHIDGLVQERCNSNALAMELLLSCTNPSIYDTIEHTVQQLQWSSFGQICTHGQQASYRVSFVSYTKKNDHDISRAHCTLKSKYIVRKCIENWELSWCPICHHLLHLTGI